MTKKAKIALTAICACAACAISIAVDFALRQSGSWLISTFLFPASYFVLMWIVVLIGDIKDLLYVWIFIHTAQYAAYGTIFARYWIRGTPKKGTAWVVFIHLFMLFIYVGSGMLWERSRT